MKVQFVYPTLIRDGAEGITANILGLKDTLERQGVEVAMRAPVLRLAQLNRKWVHITQSLRSVVHLRSALLDPSVDLVHFHASLPSQSLVARLACALAPGATTPLVGHLWNAFVDKDDLRPLGSRPEAFSHRVLNSKALARLGLSAVPEVIVSSAYQERQLRDAGYAGAVHRISNGIDLSHFRPAEPGEREKERERFGLPPDGLHVLYTGHLTPWKGVRYLVMAFARASWDYPDARLVIAHTEYGREGWRIRRDVGRLGIRDKVIFLGRVDPAALARTADIAVLPAIGTVGTAVYPNVLLEWMATGLPIIASDLPAVREVVQDGADGLLVPPGDVEALGTAIGRLLKDGSARGMLGREARRTAEALFGWERIGERVRGVYEEMLTPARASPLRRPLPPRRS